MNDVKLLKRIRGLTMMSFNEIKDRIEIWK